MAVSQSSALPMLSGKPMPMVGLGTWLSKPGEVTEATKVAIGAGYRHIDTARGYCNEKEIGEGISEMIKQGSVKREDLFITTKVTGGAAIPERVMEQVDKSLQCLQTDYIDLLLIHFPLTVSDEGLDSDPPAFFPFKDGVLCTTDIHPLDTYREMEKLVDQGKVKAIGLSNFNKEQVQKIWDNARIKPSNLQCECHAWFPQEDLINFCKEKGITFSAYGPIGSPGRPGASNESDQVLLQDPVINGLAKKYNKTPAQILLRNLLQRGLIILPKSVNKDRIISNSQLFDFELAADDMAAIKGTNREQRLFQFAFVGEKAQSHPNFPW